MQPPQSLKRPRMRTGRAITRKNMLIFKSEIMTSPLVIVLLVFAVAGNVTAQNLTLAESKELALKQNNRIGKASQDLAAINTEKQIADLAGLVRIDASATAFYFGDPISKMLPEYGLAPVVSVTQPIYTGGKILYGKQMVRNDLDMGQAQQRLVEDEVLLATETAYWQVVLSKEQIKLEHQVRVQLASQFKFISDQYQAGLIYKNDVLRAKVMQNENQARLEGFENELTIAKKKLAQLIGALASDQLDVVDSVARDFTPDHTALTMQPGPRPELDLAGGIIKRAQLTRQIFQADRKPSVGLSINGITALGKKGINFGDPSANQMISYFGMLSVKIPVLDWGARKHRVQQQEYYIKSAEFNLRELKSQIELEIDQSRLALQLQASTIQLMQASLLEADENLRLSNDRLEAGTITGEDALIAETLWQKAYSAMLEAKIRYKIVEANYQRVLSARR